MLGVQEGIGISRFVVETVLSKKGYLAYMYVYILWLDSSNILVQRE